MLCGCKSNRQAAFVMGIIFIVLNIIGVILMRNSTRDLTFGIICALVNGILVFGAHKSHSKAILVWMILAAIEALIYVIFMILIIVYVVKFFALGAWTFLIVVIVYAIEIGIVIFGILIAKRAREEIDNPNPEDNKA